MSLDLLASDVSLSSFFSEFSVFWWSFSGGVVDMHMVGWLLMVTFLVASAWRLASSFVNIGIRSSGGDDLSCQ